MTISQNGEEKLRGERRRRRRRRTNTLTEIMRKKTTVRSAPDGSDNNHSSERLTRQDLKMAREKDRDGKVSPKRNKMDQGENLRMMEAAEKRRKENKLCRSGRK